MRFGLFVFMWNIMHTFLFSVSETEQPEKKAPTPFSLHKIYFSSQTFSSVCASCLHICSSHTGLSVKPFGVLVIYVSKDKWCHFQLNLDHLHCPNCTDTTLWMKLVWDLNTAGLCFAWVNHVSFNCPILQACTHACIYKQLSCHSFTCSRKNDGRPSWSGWRGQLQFPDFTSQSTGKGHSGCGCGLPDANSLRTRLFTVMQESEEATGKWGEGVNTLTFSFDPSFSRWYLNRRWLSQTFQNDLH